MAMQKQTAAADAESYVAALTGWRKACVEALRAAVAKAAVFDETIKWGHLVYLSGGPAVLIRAEESRVIFGLWRGQRMAGIAPRLEPGGKFEMARIVYHDGDAVDADQVERLAAEAHRLNAALGDPTKALYSR